jgi:3-dehydroquinate synthetase
VQLPTSLLAQVDSAVGGKTGVNLPAGKNLVGAFHQPRLVMSDLASLDTLPEREFRSGVAEIIKYGIIRDPALFAQLEADLGRLLAREEAALGAFVARSCEIKAEVVGQDETEGGLRAVLNFGHTIGHGLEAISGYGHYLHGEAIAVGQVAAARLSRELLGLPAADEERIRGLFERSGLPTSVKLTAAQKKRLLAAMQLDKKVSGGEVRFVLAEAIGRVRWGQRVPTKMVRKVLDATA